MCFCYHIIIYPARGRQVYYKEDEIKAARRYLGYFALITNEKMDAFTALHLYRMKDVVEKAFGNLSIITFSTASNKSFAAFSLCNYFDSPYCWTPFAVFLEEIISA